MYLKTIELQGFKSFANKTVLRFNKGITGIVGPNGSGKSNVADAVRWVLGEQSAKQLRGSKMEDVIFSGTENRKPLGFAYVAITIDNQDHKLPMDFDEVTVARRVYRSGESEYLLNGSVCRLRDVQEMFFDTGIGKEGYSIIGQGQIDKILSGKPEERRELFDEAAGIVKYKKRKAMAEKNLESEHQNLCRINDILSELEKQVGPLSRQAQKAKTYLKLRDQLKSYDMAMYLTEYGRLKTLSKEYAEKEKIVSDDLTENKNALEQVRVEYDEAQRQLEICEAGIEALQSANNELQMQKQKNEGEVHLLEEQIRSHEASLLHFRQRIDEIRSQIREKQADFSQYDQEEKALDEKIQTLRSHKETVRSDLDQMTSSIEKIRQTIDDKNADIIEYLNDGAGLKAKAQRYDTMLEQIQIRKAELSKRLITAQSEASGYEEKLREFKEESQALQDSIGKLREQLNVCETRGKEIQTRIDGLHSQLSAKEEEYQRLGARYQTLQGIAERYEGYGGSIRRVMEQKKQVKGIIGVVADIIKVEKKYETAIETALGGSIQNVVTKDEKTAKQMIEYLKQNRYGRATFLPMTSIVPRALPNRDTVLKEKGVLGIGSELILCSQDYRRLADHLLGRVVVAETMDDALRIARKYKYTLRIVTLAGESLSPGGSISGGAFKNSGNLLGRHREMDELSERLKILSGDIKRLTVQADKAHDEKRENRRKMSDVTEDIQSQTLKNNTLTVNINQITTSKDRQQQTYATLKKESDELKKQVEDIEKLKSGLEAEQKALDASREAAQSAVSALNARLDEETAKEQEYRSRTSGLEVDFSGYVQKKEFISENKKRLTEEMSRLDSEEKDFEQKIRETEEAVGRRKEEIAAYEADGKRLGIEVEKGQASLEKHQADKERLSGIHKNFFDKREQLNDACSLLDKELFRLQHLQEKTEEDQAKLDQYMWDSYELTYNEVRRQAPADLPDHKKEDVNREIGRLKQEIKGLGNINLNAVEEYDQVSERYELLKSQHDDIVEAENKLTGIILSLDEAMRSQFKENFAKIQVNYDRVFKELFGGGKGSLELMEDADILDAGIRIIAQPPGKKLQNMMQLSGGEKALSAIALLFAIQSLKPSPFCLLDEIEAALDDANVKRYARYLGHLTEDTQFIIITHRRGTMNAADVLYGVTMQEKGVSTLVSVNLIENELSK